MGQHERGNRRRAHVIWDWNGTLFDDAWLCFETINWLLERHGLPVLSEARYRDIFDFPVRAYYVAAGFDLERLSFEALGTEFMTEYQRRRFECALYPDARVVLAEIADRGLTQSILSAYKKVWLDELLDAHDLRRFFTSVVGSDDHYAHGKIEAGRLAIEAMTVHASSVLLVGDTTHDFEVARALGVDCILVDGGSQSLSRLRACGVAVVPTRTDVLGLV